MLMRPPSNPARDLAAWTLIVTLVAALGCGRDPKPPAPLPAPAPAPQTEESAPAIPFADVTDERGVTFLPASGAAGEKLLPESGGAGVALFDYDGDDDSDLLLLSGVTWPWDRQPDETPEPTVAFYRNDGDRFADITSEAGLDFNFYAQGVAVGDYDADGDLDLFITGLGACRLLRNDDGVYTDVTAESGVAAHDEDWTTSAGFFDYDRDGDLDLFVCNYLEWSRELDEAAEYRIAGIGRAYAPPFNFAGTNSFLYRNDGGSFTDVSAEAGIRVQNDDTGEPVGKALAVVFLDFDRDGWLDVFVANDTVRNFLFKNDGEGHFEEVAMELGAAFDANGAATSAMGVDVAWPRNNGDLAIAVGNFANEMTSLFVTQRGQAIFTDESMATGIGGPTREALSFGLLFDDFDLDGRVDMVQANGHLEQEIESVQPSQTYRQASQLFWNAGEEGAREFMLLDDESVGDLAKPIVGRAVASADIDGDGDLDLVFSQVDGPTVLLENRQQLGRHWLTVSLRERYGEVDPVGAIVEIEAGDVVQRRLVTRTRSYLTQTPPEVTFGLGAAEKVDRLTIIWPDGESQDVEVDEVDRRIVIRRGRGGYASLLSRVKALYELARYEDAAELAKQAAAKRPEALAPYRNAARCWLVAGRLDEAQQALEQIAATDDSAAAAYLRGLLAIRQSEFDAAATNFQNAAARSPNVATVHFQLGKVLLATRDEDGAFAALQRAAELDPTHGAAQFQLANLARRRGQKEDFDRYWRDFQRIRRLKGEVVSDAQLLEACSLTEIEIADEAPATAPAPDPSYVAAPVGGLPFKVADVAVLELAAEGNYVFAAASPGGEVAVGEFDAEGSWVARGDAWRLSDFEGDAPSIAIADAVATGDESNEWMVHNAGRAWLVRASADGEFDDLTEPSGLRDAGGSFGRWADVDHDGAIDWIVASNGKLRVWRNNGDGSFAETTDISGLQAGEQFAVVDQEPDNLGVDLLVIANEELTLWKNQLGGAFAKTPDQQPPTGQRVAADDFDGDALADTLLASGDGLRLLSSRGAEWLVAEHAIDGVDALTTTDFSNDGWLDAVLAGSRDGRPVVELFANRNGRLEHAATLSDKVGAKRLLSVDLDGDSRSDLLCVDNEGVLHALTNQTSPSGSQLKLTLQSFVGQPSSIGTRVQVRWDGRRVTRFTQRQAPIEIGVGDARVIDVVQTLWNNGVVHNELDVDASDTVHRIAIVDFIRTSSCPFLYVQRDGAWSFVTDVLGGAPLNVAMTRGQPVPGDDDEVVRLAPWWEERPPAVDAVRITTELREAVLLDEVELLTVEHPTGTIVLPYDRITPNPPRGVELALVKNPGPLVRASRADGTDITAELRAIDGHTVIAGGPLLPPVVGHRQQGAIEFVFAEMNEDRPIALVLTGWFRFGSSTTNIAASTRSDVAGEWPRLEARAEGVWRPVDVSVGFPAGYTKSIVCDLTGKLPPGCDALRLSTSLEIRWDAMHLATLLPNDAIDVRAQLPDDADIGWYGVSRLAAETEGGPPIPVEGSNTTSRPWLSGLPGWYTRYGDVRPLLNTADNRFAVLATGDGVTAAWTGEQTGAAAESTDREVTQLLRLRGWIKEWDPNAVRPDSLTPYPGQTDSSAADDAEDWRLNYNTRFLPRFSE